MESRMKKQLIKLILFILISQMNLSIFAQQQGGLPIFHRLFIFNEKNEVLLVKINNTDYWVSPGIYQDETDYVQGSIETLAEAYGLTISSPVLRGMFMLRYADNTKLSIRNVFSASTKDGVSERPEFVSEVKWTKLDEA